ncbi:hypothetical protein Tco_0630632 [Tanacetum coccineum]
MEETFHVTFDEDDEAISHTSTEGDSMNFNEVSSFPDDEFIKPRNKDTLCTANTEYFPYVRTPRNDFKGFFFLVLGFNSDLGASLDPPWRVAMQGGEDVWGFGCHRVTKRRLFTWWASVVMEVLVCLLDDIVEMEDGLSDGICDDEDEVDIKKRTENQDQMTNWHEWCRCAKSRPSPKNVQSHESILKTR